MQLTIYILEVILGAGFLAFGADRFIDASVALAKQYKLPTLVIGIVLVGFGTSFPELIVSLFASLRGNNDIAVGNVVGSNIANIGLVLGVAAIIAPIKVNSRIIKQEMPTLIIITIILGFIFWSGSLNRLAGVLLLLLLALHLYIALKRKPKPKDAVIPQYEQEIKAATKTKGAWSWWLVGLIVLLASSEVFIQGAVGIARAMHINELIIGLTIVTLGTSLPEFATTIISALKSQYDVAFGHIIGSNIFNSLAVLAMPALVAPGRLPTAAIHRDYPVMLAYTLLVWLSFYLFKQRQAIGRVFGGILLAGYIGYLLALGLT